MPVSALLRVCAECSPASAHGVRFAGNRTSEHLEGYAMTDWLIAAVLFVAIVTTLVYLWKREHG
jgi:hypothetical protein